MDGKKSFRVHAQDNALAGMRCCEGLDGAAFDEAMCSRMCGDLLEDTGENLLLDMLEAEFGSFDEAEAAGVFGKDAVVVVGEGAVDQRRSSGAEALAVGKPFEFGGSDFEPLG